MRRLALFLALAPLALSGGGCSEGDVVEGAGSSGPRTDAESDDPIDFGPLPEFALVSQSGEPVTLASLRGRPLVIAALFSTCTGPCPSIARSLARLQEELRETDVLLVAVSVDPDFDSPDVLARYAERMGADPRRWIFLTGAEAEVHRLVREGFFLAVERAADDAPVAGDRVTHDTRLLAVDRAGRRRGWYAGTDETGLARLKRRMLHLSSEGG